MSVIKVRSLGMLFLVIAAGPAPSEDLNNPLDRKLAKLHTETPPSVSPEKAKAAPPPHVLDIFGADGNLLAYVTGHLQPVHVNDVIGPKIRITAITGTEVRTDSKEFPVLPWSGDVQ